MLLPKELSYDELLDSETHVTTDKRVHTSLYFRSSHGVGVTPVQDGILYLVRSFNEGMVKYPICMLDTTYGVADVL